MAKVLDISKEEQAQREAKAAEELAAAGEQVNLDAIRRQAFGTPFVVFSREFETPRLKEDLRGLSDAGLTIFETARKAERSPKQERKFKRAIRRQTAGFDDPELQQEVRQGILGTRESNIEAATGERVRAFEKGFQGRMLDFLEAQKRQDEALGVEQAREQALFDEIERQRDLEEFQAKELFKSSLRRSGGSRSGGGGLLSKNDQLLMVGLGLDPSSPEDVAVFAQEKARSSFAEDEPTPGSTEDITVTRQAIVDLINQGASEEEVEDFILDRGFDPFSEEFLDLFGAFGEEDSGGFFAPIPGKVRARDVLREGFNLFR